MEHRAVEIHRPDCDRVRSSGSGYIPAERSVALIFEYRFKTWCPVTTRSVSTTSAIKTRIKAYSTIPWPRCGPDTAAPPLRPRRSRTVTPSNRLTADRGESVAWAALRTSS